MLDTILGWPRSEANWLVFPVADVEHSHIIAKINPWEWNAEELRWWVLAGYGT